ncbi:transducin beta-like protein 3 [Amphibalanus amphitrite]|uniref:transducin beta-like protein 3 n=1 Tax=Amphibalanus amphitrite TaxID=1232801 RepID=UPI001C912F6C|nr:transducin beta-like protein 3 [Amphibalanus amphitrite]
MTEGVVKDKSQTFLKLRLESRHDAFLTEPCVQVTSDGENILCQCGDKVNVLSCASGKVLHALEAKDDPIYAMKLSPKDDLLVTSHTSGLLRLWDWKKNETQRVWKSLHIGPIPKLGFDNTATLVASGGVDGTVKVWDIVRQYCTHNLKGSVGVISTIEFYQKEKELFIYASGDDSVIRCWNLSTSEVTQELKGHFSKVTSLSICRATQQLMSSGRDKVLMLWDLRDGSLVRTVATHEVMEVAVLVPPGGSVAGIECGGTTHAITAGERGVLRVWNLSTSECVFTQGEHSSSSMICQLLFSEKNSTMTVVNHEHNILMYDIQTAELKRQYVGFSDEILDVVFCGEKESNVAVATNSSVIKVYEVDTFNCQLVNGHTNTVLSLAVSPVNKNLFASSSKDNTIRLWRLTDAQKIVCLAVGSGHTASVTSVAWSQLTTSFVVSGAEDKCVKVWDIPASAVAAKKNESAAAPAALHCRRTEIAHDKDINSVAVSPNDRLLATASQDKTARLYATEGLALTGVMRGHRRGVWSVTFSPVDQIAATCSADCTVRLWSITDASCVKTFEGHDSSVLRVAFLCRGMQLLTCSADGLLKLWSVKTNECVQTYSEHEAKVWALAVRADQRLFVSGGADSSLLVWRDVSEEEARVDAEATALRVSQEQALSNLVQQRQWLRALKLAIKLKRPFRCLQILKELRRDGGNETSQLSDILTQLRDDQVEDLLQFVVEWNTNSKHCHEAQLVLNLLLRLRPPEAWLKMSNCRTLIEGLLPYTERHFERMNRMLQSISFIDYTASCLKITSRQAPGPAALTEYPDEDLFTDAKPVLRPAFAAQQTANAEDDTKAEEDAEEKDAEKNESDPGDDAHLKDGAAAAVEMRNSSASEDSGLETEEPTKSAKAVKPKKRVLKRGGKKAAVGGKSKRRKV